MAQTIEGSTTAIGVVPPAGHVVCYAIQSLIHDLNLGRGELDIEVMKARSERPLLDIEVFGDILLPQRKERSQASGSLWQEVQNL